MLKQPKFNPLNPSAKDEWVDHMVPKELRDFRNFLFLVFDYLQLTHGPDRKVGPTPLQFDMAWWLQHGDNPRKVICAFRGVGKSWITAVYVLWRLYLNPKINVLVVSASRDRADAFSQFCLRLINEMDILEHLRPRRDQRQSWIQFDVAPAPAAHAPSVKSMGIFGQLAGSRADLIVADDVEVPNNSYSEVMREKLSNAVREFDAILKPMEPGSPIPEVIYLGTPQTEDSLYNKLPMRGYDKVVWPSRFPKDQTKLNATQHELAPYIVNMAKLAGKITPWWTPTDLRFSEDELQKREASYGRSGYALQFQLDTTLSDAEKYPLRLSDLVVMDLNSEVGPERVVWARSDEWEFPAVGFAGDRFYKPLSIGDKLRPYEGAILAIDPSGRGTDETSFAVMKILHGQLFLIDCGGFQGGYDDKTLIALAKLAKQHKVNEVICEDNFGDGMFNKLFSPILRKQHACALSEVKHHIQKEVRIIDSLEPVMNQHRLIINASIVEKDDASFTGMGQEETVTYRLFHQMTRLTRERGCLKHDDRIDVLGMAVKYWTDSMGLDVDESAKYSRDQALDDELARMIDNAENGGVITKPRTQQEYEEGVGQVGRDRTAIPGLRQIRGGASAVRLKQQRNYHADRPTKTSW